MSSPPRRKLSANVLANVVTAAAMIGTALISVPLIVDKVGLAGYGVWTLAITGVVYVTTAEAGIGPSIQRFVAVAHGSDDLRSASRLLWTALALYSLLGAAILLLAILLAPTLADLFNVAPRLHHDAIAMFRVVGVVALLALLGAAFGNVQQGLDRFVSFAGTAAIAALAYLVAIIVLLAAGKGLEGLAWAAAIQQGVVLVGRAWLLRDVLRAARPGLVSRAEGRRLAGFSLRLQMTVLSLLINSQTDKIVVGLVASGTTLGQLGIGAQVADAGRLVSGAALSPIVSRMSATHGGEDPGALEPLFARLHRLWTIAVLGLTTIGAAVLHPVLDTWLGHGHGKAALFGGFLIVAYGMNLLTGTGIAYLRAVGRPSIEARYGAVIIGVNVAGTIALGIAFGAIGVVVATLIAYVVGTAWFFARLRAAIPNLPPGELLPSVRALINALVAAGAALGWGLLMAHLLGRWVGLVPVLLGAAAALTLYLARTTGVRPTLRELRAALAS